jgi:protein-L-isoaspartate(D-aspartate) O-methyltransferase
MNKEELLIHLQNEGFSRKIINAFSAIRREDFIDEKYIPYAYEDIPLPLAPGSTISQPFTIGFMLSLLELKENIKFLEIGSGCGYVLALVKEIIQTGKVFGAEINRNVFDMSDQILKDDKSIKIVCEDGKNGLSEYAPYDRILISAACQEPPLHLLHKIKKNGIIVASVSSSILKISKSGTNYKIKEFLGFRFVPLI